MTFKILTSKYVPEGWIVADHGRHFQAVGPSKDKSHMVSIMIEKPTLQSLIKRQREETLERLRRLTEWP
ncbi:hypothetical protein [Methylobacter sp.]|uniref:hypothetical protein n=1 Tax=Methylobacter sp. TaxID=2051955 RepID=UPI00121AC6B3|nr:hypothetical protein [Methylobacter sp.]TAK59525.1 MAG: hypothetical protein EPO18_20400 [Methylobacter sp.]